MRLLVFFDLPVTTKQKRLAYTQFRRFLLNDGYDMIQWSVYGRVLNNADAEDKHIQRLKNHLPPEGSIRCMTVTEKQYAGMTLLVGKSTFQEKMVGVKQLLLFGAGKFFKKNARKTWFCGRCRVGHCSKPG